MIDILKGGPENTIQGHCQYPTKSTESNNNDTTYLSMANVTDKESVISEGPSNCVGPGFSYWSATEQVFRISTRAR